MGLAILRRIPEEEDEAVDFDHIAFGVWKLADVAPFLVGELGGRPYQAGPGNGYHSGQWIYDGGGLLEVLEPAGPPEGFLHRFLKKRGNGFHHLTFKVPDLRELCGRAQAMGYAVVGYDDSSPAWKEAFLHPKEALGIVVQLAEVHPELREDSAEWDLPPGPTPSTSPVRIVGLRMTARDADAATRQWAELLGGDRRDDDGDLVFRWPDSPMRLAVSLNPGQPAGPLWVEVGSLRPVALPQGPHPVLGARFVPVNPETD